MLSTVVMVLSLGMMLLIIASLLISALRKSSHHKSASTTKTDVLTATLDRHVSMTLHMQDGSAMHAAKSISFSPFLLPSSWYTRWRTLVSLGLLLMILLTLFVQSGLADGALQDLSRSFSFLNASQISATNVKTASHATYGNASRELVRISQLDPAQYSSTAEYNTWAYSACSAAALTEIFNAYGRHFRVTDVLKVEARIGEISPELGLLRPQGIEITSAQFGFKTTWGNNWQFAQIISTANSGTPVIVSFPPDRYAGGHILVVRGGDSNFVYLADTSIWNRRSITRAQFLQWWEGYAAVVTPA